MDALGVIDRAVQRTVLVYGSLPPAGRDIDLLVRADDRDSVSGALASAGFEQGGASWAWFGDCTAVGVDVVDVAGWNLGASAAESLFAAAVPLDGNRYVARPSPAHALLILARRTRNATGRLPDKHRQKIAAALTEEPGAWEQARAEARAWGVEAALRELERAYRVGAFRFRIPRPHRPGAVVALSGLDGAGKSAQATGLVDALTRLGRTSEAVWTPLGNNPVQRRIAAVAKRALGRGGSPAGLDDRRALGRGRGSDGASGSLAAGAWASFGGLVNGGWHLWTAAPGVARGEVVVFDRYVLDSVVHLHFAYGESAVPRALVRSLSLRPVRAYLLDVAPETALARKNDLWTLEELTQQAELYRHYAARLGVVVLDGERAREELCAEIARDVWAALGRRP